MVLTDIPLKDDINNANNYNYDIKYNDNDKRTTTKTTSTVATNNNDLYKLSILSST